MRNSLFLKVYLTLIASLVVVALASAAFVRLSHDEEDRGWGARRDAFVAAMLPANAPLAETRIVVERLAAALDADIALYDASGGLIAGAGAPVPLPTQGERSERRRGGDGKLMTVRLDDGRTAVARFAKSPFGPSRPNPLAWLALIAGVTGLVAWPVVRHLTSRLERLRHGVEAWGGGDLALRVPVEGGDEVAAVATSFNRAAGRVESLLASHRALLANASHELRSPLARLRIAADLYEAEASEERRAEIVRNLAELDELVEEILLASRLDHVGDIGASETVDLLALVAEEGARHGIEVAGEAAPVTGNPRLLARLARNLIQNALRHGAPPVEVEVRREGGRVELSVRDHGPGIPEAERERVFEPFYRPSGRSEEAGGWGLGLALVRQIAERHGARVRQETPAGGGARFVVTFPQQD
ncbi:MAG: HAMP domain-containing histidine kinase [Aquamicrobium sp.]|nr:HAMP domain-containing histidine kinase [Aquamicrobium sp.]